MSFLVEIGLMFLIIFLIIRIGDIMRKYLLVLILLLLPFSVFAYSNYIIPGGDAIGIEIKSNGVYVVGFYKIDGKYINEFLELGDKIIQVGDEEVSDSNSLVSSINRYASHDSVSVIYIRNNQEFQGQLQLVNDSYGYKTGLYVKGDTLGIGTLTYIDPNNGVYGLLGHSLNHSFNNELVSVFEGYSYDADVKSFTRSIDGSPGSKNAIILKEQRFGSIHHNSNYGLFGVTTRNIKRDVMPVGNMDEVELGKAYIYTSNTLEEVKSYEIKILDINKKQTDKNFYFEIVDKDLLEMSGGIVQGMSGSPIIQNGKIIGAVTRVLIDDVKRGYGISIVTMLEEGDKIK